MLKKFYFVLTLTVLPVLASAEALGETSTFFTNLKTMVTDVLIPLVFTLALFFFFWGVAKYIWSEGTAKAEGRQIMIWGVVALFVMASVWGLVRFIQEEFNITNNSSIPIPTIGSGGSSNI
ncbi:MAG: hypothetical protein WC657_03330 [Candidatus Paceibacterota bacterium]|jgi:hypothetical protein